MGAVNSQVLGRSSADYSFSNNANKQILIDAINANKGVTFGTSSSLYGLYGHHAYTVIGYNASTDSFLAHNPWGTSHPGPLSWSQLQAACSAFTVANTSSVPIRLTMAALMGAAPTSPLVAASEVRHGL